MGRVAHRRSVLRCYPETFRCWPPTVRRGFRRQRKQRRRRRRRPSSACQMLAPLGRGIAQADNHEIEAGADEDRLTVVARGPERSVVVAHHPPVGPVDHPVVGVDRPGPASVVDPAGGQEPPPVPHPVAEVEESETGEVPGRSVEGGGQPPRSRRRRRRASADASPAVRRGGRRGTAGRADPDRGAGPRSRDDVGRPARIVEKAPGFGHQRTIGGEGGHVIGSRPAQHLHHIGNARVDVVLGEGQSAAHLQQLLDGDGPTGIVGVGPRRDVAGASSTRRFSPPDADHRVEDRLGHRPREERRCRATGTEPRSPVIRSPPPGSKIAVALGHQPAAAHDDHGVGLGQRPVRIERFVQESVERTTHRGGRRTFWPRLRGQETSARWRGSPTTGASNGSGATTGTACHGDRFIPYFRFRSSR